MHVLQVGLNCHLSMHLVFSLLENFVQFIAYISQIIHYPLLYGTLNDIGQNTGIL